MKCFGEVGTSVELETNTIHATTCASLTTFDILFENEDDQFRTDR